MEIKFKFNNNKSITIDAFKTKLNQKILELMEETRSNGVGYYQLNVARSIGRDQSRPGDKLAALKKIKQGFDLTGIDCPVNLDNDLTIADCNIIHRVFTNSFMLNKYQVPDLQLINHGAHEYESLLSSPNCLWLDQETATDQILGFDIYQNLAKYTMDITDDLKKDLPTTADIYLNDDCRIGRSFSDAWCQDDDPTQWDIRDIDRGGPIFLFQNALRKKLYQTKEFKSWLEKYNYDYNKPYQDIPFANIVSGDYLEIQDAILVEIKF